MFPCTALSCCKKKMWKGTPKFAILHHTCLFWHGNATSRGNPFSKPGRRACCAVVSHRPSHHLPCHGRSPILQIEPFFETDHTYLFIYLLRVRLHACQPSLCVLAIFCAMVSALLSHRDVLFVYRQLSPQRCIILVTCKGMSFLSWGLSG